MEHNPIAWRQTYKFLIYKNLSAVINISFDVVLKTQRFDGGVVESSLLPIFICENNRKSNNALWSFFLSGSF